MTTISHATLTGAELHELKGADTATVGQVPVATGLGTSVWSSIDATAFTGMVADFTTPIAPSGWLELDGSIISTTTYANLYAVQTIQQNGTRTSGSAIITSIPSTTNLRAGYYVFGTGITSGTTILTVDSPTQITMSANAGSSGTSTVVVSPWLLNTGTIKLPDVVSAGRYRRSRTAGQAVGVTQADTTAAHTHTGSTGTESATHTHSINITSQTESANHTHNFGLTFSTPGAAAGGSFSAASGLAAGGASSVAATTAESATHTHIVNGASDTQNANHTHSFTTNSTGSAETRPISIVFITCVKT